MQHTYNSIYQDDSNQHHTNNKNLRHPLQQSYPNNSSSLNPPQFKIPDVQYLNPTDPNINFKNQTLKLIQANAILTQIIKDTIIQKYSLNQKIIQISDKIRKLENPHAHHQSAQNIPPNPSHQSLNNTSFSNNQK